jgi:hypothetical protein
MAILLSVALYTGVAAGPKDYCAGGENVEVSGILDEIVTTDPASPELILERSTGTCAVDAIRIEGAVPVTCREGGPVSGEGLVQVSRDGTWTWLEADDVRCEETSPK